MVAGLRGCTQFRCDRTVFPLCTAAVFRTAYQRYQFNGTNSTAEVHAVGDVLLQMIADTDAVLGTNVNYMLGPWIEDARQDLA